VRRAAFQSDKAFSLWLPGTERARAPGHHVVERAMGRRVHAVTGAWVLTFMSWRNAFVLFGAVGSSGPSFFSDGSGRSRTHSFGQRRGVGVARGNEKKCRRAWSRSPGAGLSQAPRSGYLGPYFCMGYGWSFFITWLPTYLDEAFPQLSGCSARFSIASRCSSAVSVRFLGLISGPIREIEQCRPHPAAPGGVGLGVRGDAGCVDSTEEPAADGAGDRPVQLLQRTS